MDWEIVNNRRVIFGNDTIGKVPEILQWYGLKKVFLVSFNSNLALRTKITELLEASGIEYVVYNKIKGEPTLEMINEGSLMFISEGCDCTLALGGGSVIDAAKTIGMLAVNGGLVEEYQMDGRAVTTPPPFFIAIPTTTGTGAEATKVAVVTNTHNGLKKSLYHNTMIADVVILDPSATLSMPKDLVAATGMDALSHAIESYVSLNANPITKMEGLKAISLISQSIEKACSDSTNTDARAGMLLASYMGGCAISAGIGIAHIMAQPIGALFNVSHGDACSIFLPLAMEYNLEYATEEYAQIADSLGVAQDGLSTHANALNAIAEVRRIRSSIGAPTSLAPYVDSESVEIEHVVEVIMKTTGHVKCNPREVSEMTFKEMFELALHADL